MPIKRFIAGAICPRCSAIDRLRAWQEDGIQHRECIKCDFSDAISLQTREELPTRVNQVQTRHQDEIQLIKIIDARIS